MSNVKLLRTEKLIRKLKRLFEYSTIELKQEIVIVSKDFRKQLIKTVNSGGRSGVMYSRGGKKAKRSAPGEPPKSDRGGLVKSIKVEILDEGFSSHVGTPIKYAKALEFGFAPRNLLPRPFMGPTFEKNRDKYIKRIGSAVDIAMNKTLRGR